MGIDCISDTSSIVSSMSSSRTSSSSGGGINLVIGSGWGGGISLTSISSSLGFEGMSLSRPVDDSSDSIAKFKNPALLALTDNAHLYSDNRAL